jgi:hypothetical protein
MGSTFANALSGLTANANAIGAVSGNLANLNTYGYKNNDVSFNDLVNESLSGAQSSSTVGGSTVSMTTRDFSQGSIATTNQPYHPRRKLQARFTGPSDYAKRRLRSGLEPDQWRSEHHRPDQCNRGAHGGHSAIGSNLEFFGYRESGRQRGSGRHRRNVHVSDAGL